MTSAATMLRPASIIVANWREKIWSDFGLIFLKAVRAPPAPLVDRLGQQAAQAELLACTGEIRRVDLAAEDVPRGVDGGVGEARHVRAPSIRRTSTRAGRARRPGRPRRARSRERACTCACR